MNSVTHEEALEIPRLPRRVFTATDWMYMISVPFILYLGGIAAAEGNAKGLILVAFAGLIVITLRTVRLGRRNEPRVSQWSGPGAIVVSVFGFVWSWDLFQNPANGTVEQFALPIVPVALYLIFVLAIFAPRRTR